MLSYCGIRRPYTCMDVCKLCCRFSRLVFRQRFRLAPLLTQNHCSMSVGKQLIWVDLEVRAHTYRQVAFVCSAFHWLPMQVFLFFMNGFCLSCPNTRILTDDRYVCECGCGWVGVMCAFVCYMCARMHAHNVIMCIPLICVCIKS